MAGYSLVRKVHELEERCERLGFMMCPSRHNYTDSVAVIPKCANSLPIYSRDAELFVGTLEQLEVWIHGIEWARDYDRMIKLSDNTKRERKEQDERNRILVSILRDEEIKIKE